MGEEDLLAVDEFRLFAVAARFPRNLAVDKIEMREQRPGVYEVEGLGARIRVVVVSELPQKDHNAMLHLFSASKELFIYGANHYQVRSKETSSLLAQLFKRYQQEGLTMPDMLEEFTRETIEELLRELPAEQLLKRVPAEKILEGVPVEKRLEGVPVEKRLEGVPVEKRLEGVSVDELIAGLSPQKREELARRLKPDGSPPKAE
jgi:hypothetical protein